MTKSEPDVDVLRRATQTPSVFGVLVERYHAPIHRYLRHRAGVSDADDLAAETFARAFADRRRFDPDAGSVRAWLFGIATNLLRHRHRDDKRRSRAMTRLAASTATTQRPTLVAASTMPDDLRAALLDLRPDERDLVLLQAWAGLDYAELAAATGLPAGTVRSRLHRARARLEDAISPDSPDQEPA
jgi:RNA polymerase sigma factor (sigma-70 family)